MSFLRPMLAPEKVNIDLSINGAKRGLFMGPCAVLPQSWVRAVSSTSQVCCCLWRSNLEEICTICLSSQLLSAKTYFGDCKITLLYMSFSCCGANTALVSITTFTFLLHHHLFSQPNVLHSSSIPLLILQPLVFSPYLSLFLFCCCCLFVHSFCFFRFHI